MADDLEYVYTPLIQRQLKAADALAKAVNVWEDREFGDLEDDMRQAVIDARAAYEKVRGKGVGCG